MAINASDTYLPQSRVALSEAYLRSLMCLYQPLVGGDGVLLYLTLYTQSQLPVTLQTHEELRRLLNGISLDGLESARLRLEEYQLLKTYRRPLKGKDTYAYILLSPLLSEDFMRVGSYTVRYREITGTDPSFINSGGISLADYKDITSPVIELAAYDEAQPETFNDVRSGSGTGQKYDGIDFDYRKFINSTTTLVFPAQLRTEDNLLLIGRLGSVYGLSPDAMRKLVCKCVNLETVSFDQDKLRNLCGRAACDEEINGDPYKLAPVLFLQARQNGVKVTPSDRKMLMRLSEEMHFSNEVINVMIEYILFVADNCLASNYVDKIAGQWVRAGVKNKEDALNQIKKSSPPSQRNNGQHIVIDPPAYWHEPRKKKSSEKLSAEELDELKRLQKTMGGGNYE